MTTISILPDGPTNSGFIYRAVSGARQSVGRTAGEALDALTTQLGQEAQGMLVVVQHMRADPLFSQEQRQRLAELMQRWREARDRRSSLPEQEQAELASLVDAELIAATDRAALAARNVPS